MRSFVGCGLLVLGSGLACIIPALPPPGYVDVALLAHDVPAGAELTARDVTWMRMPEQYVVEQAVVRNQPLVHAVALTPLLAHEVLRKERIEGGVSIGADALLDIQFEGVSADVASEGTVMVIIAARNLEEGVTIREEDLYAVQIAPRYLPEGVFLSPVNVIGREVCSRTLQNEFVRSERLRLDGKCGVP